MQLYIDILDVIFEKNCNFSFLINNEWYEIKYHSSTVKQKLYRRLRLKAFGLKQCKYLREPQWRGYINNGSVEMNFASRFSMLSEAPPAVANLQTH